MKFIYENDRGKVVMYGGNGDGFNIIEIRGLSLPENDIDSIYYKDQISIQGGYSHEGDFA